MKKGIITAMRRFLILLFAGILCLGLVTDLFAALTKSTAAVDEWAEVVMNTVREGATTDISDCYDAVLTIEVAISSDVAHTGSKVEVQISGNTTGDEDWVTFTKFITCIGTANPEVLGTEAAGQTVLEVSSTTGYLADETRWIFLKDDTVADSEMLFLVSHIADTSITVQDGITNAHTSADYLFNIAEVFVIQLPMSAYRVRIIYDNTYDVNGSDIHTYSRISKTTGL